MQAPTCVLGSLLLMPAAAATRMKNSSQLMTLSRFPGMVSSSA